MTLSVRVDATHIDFALQGEKGPVWKFRYGSLKEAWTGAELLKKSKDITCILFFWPHGGDVIEDTIALVSERAMQKMLKALPFDPVLNPKMLSVIRALKKVFADTPQRLVCDTAFFLTLPPASYLYAIPYEFSCKGIRKYGRNGMAHEWAMKELKERSDQHDGRVITVYLNPRTNIAAIKNGMAVEVSDGFSDAGGVVSAHGCGMIDPSLVFQMLEQGATCDQIEKVLSEESGLSVLSQQGLEFKDIFTRDSRKAKFAREFYQYQLLKYIGAYTAVLGGVEAIVFIASKELKAKNFVRELLKKIPYEGFRRKLRLLDQESVCLTQKSSSVQAFLFQPDFLKGNV